MSNEQVLVEAVRFWVDAEFPDQPDTADRAAALASYLYTEGMSVTATCREVRAFVESWSRHPSRSTGVAFLPLRLAC